MEGVLVRSCQANFKALAQRLFVFSSADDGGRILKRCCASMVGQLDVLINLRRCTRNR
jgi:hypothetical protein